MRPFIALTLALLAGLFATSLRAEDSFAPIQKAGDEKNDHANWVSFGPQFGMNINAQFKNVGNVSQSSPGPATGGGMNRTYDDGYVRLDSSGNAGGQTWNWGYQNASQVQGSTLNLHSGSSAVNGTLKRNNDPSAGFDLAVGRNLGAVLGGKWGLQAAFDFSAISISDSRPITGKGTLISDAYSLGGVIPPQAPYSGSFSGPGSLLGDSPIRTTAADTVLIAGQRKLDAQIYVLRAGPYYEFPIGKQFSARLGGGVVLAVADVNYSFNETINISGGASVSNGGANSGAEFQAGGYLEGKLIYALTRRTGLFAGAQYENLGTFSRTAGSEQAQLNMSGSVNVFFGVQFNF